MLLAWPQDPTAKQGRFGFAVDNTIGGTDQPNGWMDNWVDFFRERRLKHMLRLLNNPRCNQMGQKLCDNLEKLFEGCEVGSLHWGMHDSCLPVFVVGRPRDHMGLRAARCQAWQHFRASVMLPGSYRSKSGQGRVNL